ncbi:MAG: hypothetical protein AB1696_10440 [Planctomycetota bacterium]
MSDPTALLTQGVLPAHDHRVLEAGSLDFPYRLPSPESKEEWEKRAEFVRQRILLSGGLLPMPPRTPLRAKVFDKVEYDGFSVEKVYFESYPGFLVTGNLFRPLGRKGKFPGVLCPHGHWGEGRLAHTDKGSVPGRCLTLARLGFVVFMYDMVGYNDSGQVKHRPPNEFGPATEIWGVTTFGLQLWNSIRSIDFLQSLPDVRKDKIGCTGTSGGGTQTYMVAAVDRRVTCAAPVCMMSGHFQGGCHCENGPQLRLDGMNNVEVVGAFAPRPVILISCPQDWTNINPVAEAKALKNIYKLYGAEDRVASAHFDAPHNYNQDSREAMYAWFCRWLKGDRTVGRKIAEPPFKPLTPDELLIFKKLSRPKHAPEGVEAIQKVVNHHERQIANLRSKTRKQLTDLRKMLVGPYRMMLSASLPTRDELAYKVHCRGFNIEGCTAQGRIIMRRGVGDNIPAIWLTPKGAEKNPPTTLVVAPEGKSCLLTADGTKLSPLAAALLARGHRVMAIDTFLTGEMAALRPVAEQVRRANHFHTYNRTETAHRVQDILSTIAALTCFEKAQILHLVGIGQAGIWCLLARPLASITGMTVCDMNGFDMESDTKWAEQFFIPLIRRVGDVRAAVALAAPAPLCLHNLHKTFPMQWAKDVYRASGSGRKLSIHRRDIEVEALASLVSGGRR